MLTGLAGTAKNCWYSTIRSTGLCNVIWRRQNRKWSGLTNRGMRRKSLIVAWRHSVRAIWYWSHGVCVLYSEYNRRREQTAMLWFPSWKMPSMHGSDHFICYSTRNKAIENSDQQSQVTKYLPLIFDHFPFLSWDSSRPSGMKEKWENQKMMIDDAMATQNSGSSLTGQSALRSRSRKRGEDTTE